MKRDDTLLLAVAALLNERLGPIYTQLESLGGQSAERLAVQDGLATEFEALRALVAERPAKGDPGPQGDRGPPGESIKGDIGPTGDRGPQGDSGPAGPIGASVRGEPGPQGDLGPAGIKGDPGVKGDRGDDGVFPDVRHWIAGAHGRGTVVTHAGGTWQAKCDSIEEPGAGGEWRCLAAGVKAIFFEQSLGENPRKAVLTINLSDGTHIEKPVVFQVPLHKRKWEPDKEYELNDECAWEGHSWRAAIPMIGVEPGKSEDWILVSMRGNRGPQGPTGERGYTGFGTKGDPGPKGDKGESIKGDKGERGDDGASGVVGPFRRAYQRGELYKKNDVCNYLNILWIAKKDTDAVPGTDEDAWEVLLSATPYGKVKK